MRRLLFAASFLCVIGVSVNLYGSLQPPGHGLGTLKLAIPTANWQAQHNDHTSNATGASGLALAIDGAINPELIPDDRAYAHYLKAMASVSPQVRAGALMRAGLNESDRAQFADALSDLKGELEALSALRKTNAIPQKELLQRQRLAETDARARVQGALSPRGMAQLDRYIRDTVKQRIKIYRGPMTPARSGQ
jgi:hypothetical protein